MGGLTHGDLVSAEKAFFLVLVSVIRFYLTYLSGRSLYPTDGPRSGPHGRWPSKQRFPGKGGMQHQDHRGENSIVEKKQAILIVPRGSMPGGSVLGVGRGCCRVKSCGSAGSICAGMKC